MSSLSIGYTSWYGDWHHGLGFLPICLVGNVMKIHSVCAYLRLLQKVQQKSPDSGASSSISTKVICKYSPLPVFSEWAPIHQSFHNIGLDILHLLLFWTICKWEQEMILLWRAMRSWSLTTFGHCLTKVCSPCNRLRWDVNAGTVICAYLKLCAPGKRLITPAPW